MVDNNVLDFAKYLATLTDDSERARAIAQAKIKAVDQAPEEAFEAPIRTLAKYLSDPIKVPPVLVNPYIVVRGGMTCTVGRAGKGKTVMNLNRLLRWSAGLPMFDGWKDKDGAKLLCPDEPRKILVIENEGAGGLFHRQIGIMLHAEGFLSEEDRKLAKENILIWGEGGYSGLKLDDDVWLNKVRQGCETWEPDIVFVEPFRGLWHGEENSSTDMAVVVDNLLDIGTEFDAGIMLAHHERKSGVGEDGEKMSAGRGSTVLEGAVTVMENFEATKGGNLRELTWSKSRHGAAPNPVSMEWVPDAWWYKRVAPEQIEEEIITALRGNADEAMSVRDLAEELDDTQARLRPALLKMVDSGKLKKGPSVPMPGGQGTSGARYRLPTDENASYGGLSI